MFHVFGVAKDLHLAKTCLLTTLIMIAMIITLKTLCLLATDVMQEELAKIQELGGRYMMHKPVAEFVWTDDGTVVGT